MRGRKDATRIRHMIQSVERLEVLMRDVDQQKFIDDFVIHTAAERLLEIIGEAAARLSDEFKQAQNHIPWNQMKNLRNIISHEYFEVDYNALWDIIQNDVPKLKSELLRIIEDEDFEA